MKKSLILILCVSSLFCLNGCNKKKNTSENNEEKVHLLSGRVVEKKDDVTTYYTTISETALENKLSNPAYNNFMLYYYDSTCEGCQNFAPVLNQAIIDYDLEVFAIESSSLPSTSSFITDKYLTPTIFLYENGEIKYSFSPTKYEEMYDTKAGFKKFLDEYVVLPSTYFIDKGQLDDMISSSSSFVVEYIQEGCSQCSYISKIFLKDYITNEMKDKKFYLVAKEDILSSVSEEEKSDYWNNFKQEYGFQETWKDGTSNPYGLGSGWTPTFHYYEKGKITDAAHPFATFDGTEGKIVRHYYDDDPFAIGTEYESSSAYKEATGSYFAGKLKTFLDAHL